MINWAGFPDSNEMLCVDSAVQWFVWEDEATGLAASTDAEMSSQIGSVSSSSATVDSLAALDFPVMQPASPVLNNFNSLLSVTNTPGHKSVTLVYSKKEVASNGEEDTVPTIHLYQTSSFNTRVPELGGHVTTEITRIRGVPAVVEVGTDGADRFEIVRRMPDGDIVNVGRLEPSPMVRITWEESGTKFILEGRFIDKDTLIEIAQSLTAWR